MGLFWWLPGWFLHTAPVAAQVAPAVREVISLSDAAVAFSGVVLLYLARQVMHVKEQLGSLEGLPKAMEKMADHLQKVSDLVTTQRVEIVNLSDDVMQNRRKLDQCPYHGPDRRFPMQGQQSHE